MTITQVFAVDDEGIGFENSTGSDIVYTSISSGTPAGTGAQASYAPGSEITSNATGKTYKKGTNNGNAADWREFTFTDVWQIKSSAYTATSGDALLINTTSAAITITLPATPASNDYVDFVDYAGTFATNNLIISRNSLKILRLSEDLVVSTNNVSFRLTYIDTTVGWLLL